MFKSSKNTNGYFKKASFSKNLFVWSFLAYPLILFLVFYVGVNFNSIIMAFRNYQDGSTQFVGFQNFTEFMSRLFADGDIIRISVKNSLIIYITSLVICVPLYLLFSYLLFKKVKGHKTLLGFIMIPTIVSSMVFALIFKYFTLEGINPFLSLFGIKDSPDLLGSRYAFWTMLFYSMWVSFSASLIIYPNAMRSINPEVLESAKVDGVSNIFQELWYIILPQIYPTLVTFIVVGFATILTNSGVNMLFFQFEAPGSTYNFGYYYLVEVFKNTNNVTGYGVLAAGGIIMTIVMAPLTLLLKYILEKFSPLPEQ
jgi:ABC-type sugar transport system permease subunit